MKIKAMFLGFMCVVWIVVQPVFAGNMIERHSGTIEVIQPDGVVIKVNKNEALPDIPSGSTIKIIHGEVFAKPSAGFVDLEFGDTKVTVGEGARVVASVNQRSGKTSFRYGGAVRITKGDTTVDLKKGQRADIDFDQETGKVTVKSKKGKVKTITSGIVVLIPNGGITEFILDRTRDKLNVTAEKGDAEIVSSEGNVTTVGEGQEVEIETVKKSDASTIQERKDEADKEEKKKEPKEEAEREAEEPKKEVNEEDEVKEDIKDEPEVISEELKSEEPEQEAVHEEPKDTVNNESKQETKEEQEDTAE